MLTKILRPLIPSSVLAYRRKKINDGILNEWKNEGYPLPPPHLVKQMTIQEYQQKHGCDTFIETGTFQGAMVEAQKKHFKKVFSIELSPDFFEKATQRFSKDANVTIVQGDSGKVLATLLKDIHSPVIFFLDGHYSHGATAKGDKECPIYEEIDAIFNNQKLNHVILIDDARCFVGEGDYPAIDKLTDYVKSKNASYKVEVKHDIIRYTL